MFQFHRGTCLRTSDDLGDLLGNGCLTGPVELQAQVSDHFIGIGGCCIHSGAAGSLFGSTAFAQGTIEDTAQILGDDGGENLLGAGLIDGSAAAGSFRIGLSLLGLQGQQLLIGGNLGKDGDEIGRP